ncbi:MAG TPA: lipoyl(octanoyl) transferase LipB [Casimicrobiaceae bacterium]|nr:lipoyl(octanoyl) transferase LipB [Casimicrobiaceae bacterium]
MAPAREPAERGEPCRVRRLGQTDYESTWRAMRTFTDARTAETPDEIWLTEHPSIYTLGLAGRREHLLRDNGIPVLKVDRGGQVTYHGPGQIVAYLLIDIARRRLGVRLLVRAIEASVIQLLDSYGVAATVRSGAPGVYVQAGDREAKIAALGLKIRNGRSYHGLALNIDMDLAPFADIDPCGFRGLAVTRLRDLGIDAPRAEIESRLAAALEAAIGAAISR